MGILYSIKVIYHTGAQESKYTSKGVILVASVMVVAVKNFASQKIRENNQQTFNR